MQILCSPADVMLLRRHEFGMPPQDGHGLGRNTRPGYMLLDVVLRDKMLRQVRRKGCVALWYVDRLILAEVVHRSIRRFYAGRALSLAVMNHAGLKASSGQASSLRTSFVPAMKQGTSPMSREGLNPWHLLSLSCSPR